MNHFIDNPISRAICKLIYKYSHSQEFRHNRYYWPYYSVERNKLGGLDKIYYLNKLIIDNTILEKPKNNKAMLIATGPSINKIDPKCFQQSDIDYIGVNGAISLGINFKYYILIDDNFIKNRFDLVINILENSDCTLFITPKCLHCILRHTDINKIECKIKVIETITDKVIKTFLSKEKVVDPQLNHYYFKENNGFSTCIFHSVFDYFTVAYVALQIIYALDFKTIYLAGLDMNNFSTPRFYENAQNKQPTLLDRHSEGIFSAFDVAAEFFNIKNIQVFNLSSTSAVDSFPKINANQIILGNK